MCFDFIQILLRLQVGVHGASCMLGLPFSHSFLMALLIAILRREAMSPFIDSEHLKSILVIRSHASLWEIHGAPFGGRGVDGIS